MQKKIVAFLMVALLLMGSLPQAFAEDEASAEPEKSIGFSDVSVTHDAYEAIIYMQDQDIINGKTETEFFPDDPVKREEFAKIAMLAFKLPSASSIPLFYDMPAGRWYVDYVASVVSAGVMEGIGENIFGIGGNITRQDLATVLKRYADSQKLDIATGNTVSLADFDTVSDYAKEAVSVLVGNGMMKLTVDGFFRPNDYATRGEVAQAVYCFVKIRAEISEAKGRNASMSERLDGPYDVPDDDRLAKSMPELFDVNNYPKREIFHEDFEDSNYNGLIQSGFDNVTFLKDGGYGDNGGCMKVSNNSTSTSTNPRFYYIDYDARPGDYYHLSVMVKGENIQIGNSGHYRGFLQYYDQNRKWLTESSGKGKNASVAADSDWVKLEYTLPIPQVLNVTEDITSFYIYVGTYLSNMSGDVYVDDMILSKVALEPMDMVMMKPNYKGLIYGEGGEDDIAIRTYVHDYNGGYDMSALNHIAMVTDKDGNVIMKTESDIVTNVMDTHFSSASLTMGEEYWVESHLVYKETGELLSKREWCIRKREESYRPKIYVDEYNRIVKDGKSTIPMAAYNHGGYERVSDLYLTSPLTTFGDFATEIAFHNTEQYQKIEKEIADSGMDFITELAGIWWSAPTSSIWKSRIKEQKDVRGFITRQVNDMKDLPWMGYYYVHDEINPVNLGKEIAWNNEIVASLDLDHPTISAIDNNFPTMPGVFAQGADILGGDPYPVTGKDSQDISRVYKHLAETKAMNPGRPIYLISQGFWFQQRGDLRGPTEQEYRNMIFQGLAAGAVMFNAYSLRELIRRGSAPGKTTEESWAEYMKVHSEVKVLEPILLSTEISPYYEVRGGGNSLYSFSRRYDGKSYVFAVSTANQPRTIAFHLDGVKKIRSMYTDKIYEADDEGWFQIDFDVYGTDVFEYEQADYKSSHAELKSFTLLDNGIGLTLLDTESDNSSIMVGDKKEVSYSVKASEKASVMINGELMEMTGVIDISNLTEITVKVVSEDGRFSTEKTYTLNR